MSVMRASLQVWKRCPFLGSVQANLNGRHGGAVRLKVVDHVKGNFFEVAARNLPVVSAPLETNTNPLIIDPGKESFGQVGGR